MFKSSSVVEQLAAYLSEQIKEGRWSDVLPGRNALAKELNINGSTLERALGLLEREGLLESQGVGKRRRIKQSEVLATRQLRVLIVLYDRCLDSLFKVTPPDAILVDEITLYGILQHYLVHKRGAEHRRVIRICMEYHPIFEWYRPSVPHLYWNSSKIVQRIVRWVSHVAKGQEDVKQTRYSAKFVEGGALAALERQ